jgi:hypothetical protein
VEVRDEGLGGAALGRHDEAAEARGVEDVRGEVAPERAPERAVGRAGDALGSGVPGVEVDGEGRAGVVREGVGVDDDQAPAPGRRRGLLSPTSTVGIGQRCGRACCVAGERRGKLER